MLTRLLLSCLLGLFSSVTMATETPQYSVVQQDGDFEIRRYDPRIVADVLVEGDMDAATRQGFRTLARYIFGDNQLPTLQPVTVTAEDSGKIAMTAPVSVEPVGSSQSFATAREWRVEFTMPSQYTLTTLPKPNNPAIRIREIPSRSYAAVRYSGMNTEQRILDETRRLQDWISRQGLSVNGMPELARYNPPWTLPIFRRNEILIPLSAN